MTTTRLTNVCIWHWSVGGQLIWNTVMVYLRRTIYV